MQEKNIKNKLSLPKVEKIVINMGTADLSKNKESWEKLISELAKITGQKPKVTRAKVSIAGFNLREGQLVGLKVTLRHAKMLSFLEKLTKVILPRLRDFRGIPKKGFDKNGNYTLGLAEHTVFPEIDITKVDRPRGLEISIVTNAGSPEKGFELLKSLGFPLEK